MPCRELKGQEMSRNISDILLSQVSEFVASQVGLHFPKGRWPDLERGFLSAAQEFGFKDAESCIRWLLSSPLTKKQIEVLASHLTVGETYFFRDKNSFEILESHILPELTRSRGTDERRLRVWSAGCATGEEPYSIAILISRVVSDLRDRNITILATDINPTFLRKASEGVYSEWSFRDTPSWIKERYFKKREDGRFEILPHYKEMVTFSCLNMAEDAYPSLLNNTNDMDIIFCRNVLMYFAPKKAEGVIQNLYHCLVDDGWLIVSPSELSHVLFSQFAAVNFPGTILYNKDSKGSKGPQTAQDFPYGLNNGVEVSFQPPLEVAAQSGSEFTLAEESRGLPLLEVEKRKVEEPEQTPYVEALALYERGLYAEATENLLQLLSYDLDDSKALSLLSRACANQGKLAEALEWCKKAIAADRFSAELHYLHGTVLQEQGAFDDAIISLKRVLYLDQDFVLAYVALGHLALRQGKVKESEKHFGNALSLLSAYRQEEVLPESEGMTAGRLREIISTTMQRNPSYGAKATGTDAGRRLE